MASTTTLQQANASKATTGTLMRSELSVALGLLRLWPLWVAVAIFLGATFAAYQVPHTYTIDIGSPSDGAYARNFHGRLIDTDTGPNYRWSDVYGYVLFPGLGGSRPFTVTMTFDTARKASAQVIVNG